MILTSVSHLDSNAASVHNEMVPCPFPLAHEVTHWPLPDPELVPLKLLTTHAACLWLAPFPEAEKVPVY